MKNTGARRVGGMLAAGLAAAAGTYGTYNVLIHEPTQERWDESREALHGDVVSNIQTAANAPLDIDSRDEFGQVQAYLEESGKPRDLIVMRMPFSRESIRAEGDTIVGDESTPLVESKPDITPLEQPRLIFIGSIGLREARPVERLAAIGPDGADFYQPDDELSSRGELTFINPVMDLSSEGMTLTGRHGQDVVRTALTFADILELTSQDSVLINGAPFKLPLNPGGLKTPDIETLHAEQVDRLTHAFGDRLILETGVINSGEQQPSSDRLATSHDERIIGHMPETGETIVLLAPSEVI